MTDAAPPPELKTTLDHALAELDEDLRATFRFRRAAKVLDKGEVQIFLAVQQTRLLREIAEQVGEVRRNTN